MTFCICSVFTGLPHSQKVANCCMTDFEAMLFRNGQFCRQSSSRWSFVRSSLVIGFGEVTMLSSPSSPADSAMASALLLLSFMDSTPSIFML